MILSHIHYFVLAFLFISAFHLVSANTEKVIFIAPAASQPLDTQYSPLETLSPHNPYLKKVRIELSFDKITQEYFALEELDIGRKYEVRICWPASVSSFLNIGLMMKTPTQFNLVIEPTNSTISPGGRIEERKRASKTYLKLTASPAFLSHRREFMESPPPVYFDLSICPFHPC